MEKILVAMSGGVDSSATAILLQEQGYDVEGVTFSLFDPKTYNTESKTCGTETAISDAKELCQKLGIKHHVMYLEERFKSKVVDNFTDSYIDGRTPNPCVECNKYVKFSSLIKKADELGINKIATGHYARVTFIDETDRYAIKKARYIKKDQSYFLYTLKQEVLSRLVLPLGDFESKDEVRAFVAEKGFSVASKTESQDICFIPDKDYVDFLKKHTDIEDKVGNFVDINRNVIGTHKGYFHYTIGQRRGLGTGFGKRYYVKGINPEQNEVILAEENFLMIDVVKGKNLNLMMYDNLEMPLRCFAKVRYSQNETDGILVVSENDNIEFKFHAPQKAVAKGQSIVFYKDDVVVGGAEID